MKGFGDKPKKKVKSIKIDLMNINILKHDAYKYIKNHNFKKAEQIYIQCLREGIIDKEIYSSLANLYQQIGQFNNAIKYFKKALRLSNNDANLFFNLGLVFFKQKNVHSAIDCYVKGLNIDPNNTFALLNLANMYEDNSQFELALDVIKKCSNLNSNDPKVIFAHGNILKSIGRYNEALKKYNEVLSLDQNFLEARTNIGCVLHQSGKIDEGIKYFKDLINSNGSCPKIETHLSHLLLLKGNYEEGLNKYDYRLIENLHHYSKYKNLKRWENESFPNNYQLLITSEQGLGDTIQFCRYLIPLKQKGIDIIFCVQEKLKELIKVSNLVEKVYTDKNIPTLKNAKWIPLLSIPRLLGVNPLNPIIDKPYLKPPDTKINKWRKILRINNKPTIGINWQGNPEIEKDNLRGRSLSLNFFKGIASKDINLISLQKGFGTEQIEKSSFKNRFVKQQNEISLNWDFVDNASIIFNCDLIITSDTAVAHLAGSMGKQTWLLLQKIPDWRWGLVSELSFWYPNTKLFRQTSFNNWDEVLTKVILDLDEFILNY